MVIPISSLRTVWSSGRIATQLAPRARRRRLRDARLAGHAFGADQCCGSGGHSLRPPRRPAAEPTRQSIVTLALPSGFHWRISRWNPMFPGSHELLVQQNQELDRTQSFRVTNEIDLIQHELSQELVPVNETEALKLCRRPDRQPAILPSLDARFPPGLQPGVLRAIPLSAAGQFPGANHGAAAPAAAPQPLCSSGMGRHGLDPPGGRQLRLVAARPDFRAIRMDHQLSASVERSGHGGSHRRAATGIACCGLRQVRRPLGRSLELVGGQ